MNYKEQLQSPEWHLKRNIILKRDNYRCTECNIERSPFLRLSKNFGIKSYEEMIENGYSFFGHELNNENKILCSSPGFLNNITFIEPKELFILEKCNFALQKVETKNIFEFDKYNLICFMSKISENEKISDLNIHHKYYIENRLAWEYKDDVLITLCSECHQIEHEKNEIFVYDEFGKTIYRAEKCDKCFGSGYLSEFQYWQQGICFNCNGHGVKLN